MQERTDYDGDEFGTDKDVFPTIFWQKDNTKASLIYATIWQDNEWHASNYNTNSNLITNITISRLNRLLDAKDDEANKILGIFKKKIQLPPPPIFETITISKIVCSKCKNEIVLFDSRYYGYDGVNSDNEAAKKYVLDFKVRTHKLYGVEVVVENELSLREFNDAVGKECSFECYSNSFSNIRINITDEKGKKSVLCDSETA